MNPTCNYWTNDAEGGGLCSGTAVAVVSMSERDWAFACPEHAAICAVQAREKGWTITQYPPQSDRLANGVHASSSDDTGTPE